MTTVASEPNASLSASVIRKTYPILEMTCAACAVSVESMLENTPGVSDAGVNNANQRAWVQFDASAVTPAKLQTALRSIGYGMIIDAEDPEQAQQAPL